jgi:cytochrome c
MKKTASLICALILAAGIAVAQDEKAAPDKGSAGDVAKGKEVFEQCGACHNTDTDEKKMGPSLKGLSKRAKLANGKPNTDANLKAVINEGGNGMPGYADLLTDEEKADVLAYIKTL